MPGSRKRSVGSLPGTSWVTALQRAGHRVAMVGDGMNDGPVLARADLSVAMGQGVPLAQQRSDFILQGGRLDAVALLLRQAGRTRRIVRQNLGWAAGYNALSVPLAVAGLMPAWLAGLGMAASSLLVVLNAARLARLPRT
jgi:P-type Cu2+ transporter